MSNNNVARFEQSKARPMRFENLRPGSYFMIEAEPSRNIAKSRDQRMYRKAFNGFYAVQIADGSGAVLMPFDIVKAYRRTS